MVYKTILHIHSVSKMWKTNFAPSGIRTHATSCIRTKRRPARPQRLHNKEARSILFDLYIEAVVV